MNKTWICYYASGIAIISCPTTAPCGRSIGGGLNDAGFQIMSKQSTAQGRDKKPDKSAPGGTPDEQAPAARTYYAPNMEVLLAKIDDKFEALRREQSALAPATADPSSQPDEQPDGGRPAQPVSHHRAAKRGRSLPSLDRVVNSTDSECTDSNSPAKDIGMRTSGRRSGTDRHQHQVIPLLTWVRLS